ncbi:short chain dehydrogenase domain-containing protein [Phthorimaea operculella]|nr:short chain dehydrogenase domain-containing protein [Phthorimaea operculella]
MASSSNIKDKVFIVTGGAAGVGAALVNALLTENARYVAFLDIKEREGSTLETHLLHKFGALRSKFIKCDIADESQLVAAFQLVLDKCRRLDVVINNAAVLAEEEEFRKMADINFVGTVSSTLKAIDAMTAEKGGDGGTVLNVSSLLALKHRSRLPVYSATKAAVLHFSNSIGAEDCYANSKVRVMTVCLGPTDTAILQRQNLANFDKDCAKSLTSRVPVRQRVESAANGILEVIKSGKSGSTWVVANDDPAEDITDTIEKAYGVMPKIVD